MRLAAISTGPNTLLDHLAPLCSQLDIPLIVSQETDFELGKYFYPQTSILFKDFDLLSFDYLAKNYDALMGCGKFWSMELEPLFQLMCKKRMRFVFCPHGNSDKETMRAKPSPQDIILIYGDQMLNDHKEYRHVIKVGNYRHKFYTSYQDFYDKLAYTEVFSKLRPNKPSLLYAPTWCNVDDENNFATECLKLIDNLSPDYNIIVKLHPFLEERFPGVIYPLQLHHENRTDVLFVQKFPLIYPLLGGCTCYIGDYSSIGYDALALDLPLFFYQSKAMGAHIHSCGMHIPSTANPCSFIKENLKKNQEKYADARKKTKLHAFGETLIFPPQKRGEAISEKINLDLKNLFQAALQEL